MKCSHGRVNDNARTPHTLQLRRPKRPPQYIREEQDRTSLFSSRGRQSSSSAKRTRELKTRERKKNWKKKTSVRDFKRRQKMNK